MNRNYKIILGLSIILISGCASSQMRSTQETAQANQKILRENEARLNSLEESITALNTQMAQLNNRVYEVRTRTGQKTSMTVVPIAPKTQQSQITAKQASPVAEVKAPENSSQQNTQTANVAGSQASPIGRKIDPAAKPAPLQAASQKTTVPKPATTQGRIGQPARAAGPTGQIAALPPQDDLSLPPAELPPAESVPTQVTTNAIQQPVDNSTPAQTPVPNIYAGDLSLPPEQTATPINVTPTEQKAPVQTARATPGRSGEEAAYNAALNAARTGRIAEAIPMFRNFLQQYPNSRYTANADYWLGECLYSQGKLQDALSQFQTVNTSYPTHHKNADALLKAGMTLSRMGDKAGAQEKYRTLLNSFPTSDAAKRVRAMGVSQ